MDKLRFVGVALVAGTVGAAVALLLAPQSGRDTRKKLGKGFEKQKDRVLDSGRRIVDDAGDYLEDQVKHGRKVVEGLADSVSDGIDTGRKRITRIVGA